MTTQRRCVRCLRARCLCALALSPPREHAVELVILQHPLEQYEVKGTARLLALSLRHCQIMVGETFERPPNPQGRQEALLYPGPSPCALAATNPQQLRLFVLDGTWRKSRLLLHRNAWLQTLPRLALMAPKASQYTIRTHAGRSSHQLSTLEAVASALGELEPNASLASDLLMVQAGLVTQSWR